MEYAKTQWTADLVEKVKVVFCYSISVCYRQSSRVFCSVMLLFSFIRHSVNYSTSIFLDHLFKSFSLHKEHYIIV